MLFFLTSLLSMQSFADDCAGGGALPPDASKSEIADMGVRPSSMLTQQTGGQLFGETVATGDFNGDGLGDFAVGSPGEGGGGRYASGSATWASCRL